jgi:Protein of unknown function (DUF3313)
MNHKSRQTFTSILLIASLLAGCKAAPAPSVGFADPKELKNDPNIPFDKFWRKPGLDIKSYDKLYIADVNTAYMLQTTDWQQGERQGQITNDVHTLAVYTHDSIAKAFREDPRHRFAVLDKPTKDPHVLVIEFAIVQVVPSKVLLNALGYAPFFVGTGLTIVRTIADDKSSVAFEARVRDASTNEVVMQAADREEQTFAVVDLRGLTWYSDAEEIIDNWSKEFVLVANTAPGEKVAGAPIFRLLPW